VDKWMNNNSVRLNRGFSLLELMISTGILIIIMVGLFYTYISCFELNEFSRNCMLANNALQAHLETIRETYSFDDLDLLHESSTALNTYGTDQPLGIIRVDVYTSIYNNTEAEMKYVRLVACWQQKSGRVIGEDTNLDGILDDATEDIINPNRDTMDSPAEITALITRVL